MLSARLDSIKPYSNKDFVVVGEGEDIDFNQIVINLICKTSTTVISTNPKGSVDAICDGNPCILPSGGVLVAPFSLATGKQAITIGKPHPLL